MPLYEYNCKNHGLFEYIRPVGLSKHPAPCPTCGKLGARAYTAPLRPQIDPIKKSAIDRNIKNQYEPHVCDSSCGHDHHEHEHGPAPSSKPKARQQEYTGPRSWVIEHARS